MITTYKIKPDDLLDCLKNCHSLSYSTEPAKTSSDSKRRCATSTDACVLAGPILCTAVFVVGLRPRLIPVVFFVSEPVN